MTPGSHAPSPYTPQTPGASLDMIGQSDWYSPDIEVTIRDTHDDNGLCGQVGIIRGVTPGMNYHTRLKSYSNPNQNCLQECALYSCPMRIVP